MNLALRLYGLNTSLKSSFRIGRKRVVIPRRCVFVADVARQRLTKIAAAFAKSVSLRKRSPRLSKAADLFVGGEWSDHCQTVSCAQDAKLSVDISANVAIYDLSIFCLPNFVYRAIGTAL
jgi:hypothetical protein